MQALYSSCPKSEEVKKSVSQAHRVFTCTVFILPLNEADCGIEKHDGLHVARNERVAAEWCD
jgi:hypothetical protein